MTHKEMGIDKNVTEPVYCADVLADTQLRMTPLEARGAWYECLFNIWTDKTIDRIEGTVAQLAALWSCPEDVAASCIEHLKQSKPCDVTERNGIVTLVNRRRERKLNANKSGAKRQAKARAKKKSNAPVTRKKPSLSLSLPLSLSNEEIKEIETSPNYPSALTLSQYFINTINGALPSKVIKTVFEMAPYMVLLLDKEVEAPDIRATIKWLVGDNLKKGEYAFVVSDTAGLLDKWDKIQASRLKGSNGDVSAEAKLLAKEGLEGMPGARTDKERRHYVAAYCLELLETHGQKMADTVKGLMSK